MNARHGGRVAAMRCSVFFLCMFSFLLGAAVPRVAAVTYVYDVPYFERIDVRDVDAAEASSAQLSVSQEAFASPSGEARGASTTLSSPSVATEAAADVPAYARSQYGRVSPGSRGAVLEENPTCLYCGKSPSTQVDHVTSLKEDWNTGGWADDAASRTARVNDSGNLVGACQPCNGSKNALPLGEGSGQWWPSGWPSGVWWPFGGP